MIEIDRYKIYESQGYKFKNFVCLTEEEKRMLQPLGSSLLR